MVEKKLPPGIRTANCCGTCQHWERDPEEGGLGGCLLYPTWWPEQWWLPQCTEKPSLRVSTEICDDYKVADQ